MDLKDETGRNAISHCISPLAFASFENTTILSALLHAGASVSPAAAETAATSGSGKMLQCMLAAGAVPEGLAHLIVCTVLNLTLFLFADYCPLKLPIDWLAVNP